MAEPCWWLLGYFGGAFLAGLFYASFFDVDDWCGMSTGFMVVVII